jgi:hypothetical protein
METASQRCSRPPHPALCPSGARLGTLLAVNRVVNEGSIAIPGSEEVYKPDSVLARNQDEQRSFLWAGRCRPARATYPRDERGPRDPLVGLAPGGVCRALTSPPSLVGTAHRFTDSPRPKPWSRLLSVALSPDRSGPPLAATLPCGVRTFLSSRSSRDERPLHLLRPRIDCFSESSVWRKPRSTPVAR